MRKIFAFFVCVSILILSGCTTETNPGSDETYTEIPPPRPVRKRLCSMVILGNLGDFETEMRIASFADDSAVYAAGRPAARKDKSVISSLFELEDMPVNSDLEELQRLRQELQGPGNGDIRPETGGGFPSISMSTTTGPREAVSDSLELEDLADEDLDGETANALLAEELFTEPAKETPGGGRPRPLIDLSMPSAEDADMPDEDDFLQALTPPGMKQPTDVDVKNTPMKDSEGKRLPTEDELDKLLEEHVQKFLELNKTVPEGVLREISTCNFQNYSIWFGQSNTGVYYAVRYFEYVGDNFPGDFLLLLNSPEYRKWTDAQREYVRPMSSLTMASAMDVWLEMSELFHTTSIPNR